MDLLNSKLREIAPACVEKARREIERRTGIGELMGKVVGAEGDF